MMMMILCAGGNEETLFMFLCMCVWKKKMCGGTMTWCGGNLVLYGGTDSEIAQLCEQLNNANQNINELFTFVHASQLCSVCVTCPNCGFTS
jgi:hypothetical protein